MQRKLDAGVVCIYRAHYCMNLCLLLKQWSLDFCHSGRSKCRTISRQHLIQYWSYSFPLLCNLWRCARCDCLFRNWAGVRVELPKRLSCCWLFLWMDGMTSCHPLGRPRFPKTNQSSLQVPSLSRFLCSGTSQSLFSGRPSPFEARFNWSLTWSLGFGLSFDWYLMFYLGRFSFIHFQEETYLNTTVIHSWPSKQETTKMPPLNTATIGMAVTPAVVSTLFSHVSHASLLQSSDSVLMI